MEERVQLRGADTRSEKKKGEFVPKEVQDKQKVEGSCMKCRRNNHQARNYKTPTRAKTPSFPDSAHQELVQNKRKFNCRHLKITELGSKEDSENQ